MPSNCLHIYFVVTKTNFVSQLKKQLTLFNPMKMLPTNKHPIEARDDTTLGRRGPKSS